MERGALDVDLGGERDVHRGAIRVLTA